MVSATPVPNSSFTLGNPNRPFARIFRVGVSLRKHLCRLPWTMATIGNPNRPFARSFRVGDSQRKHLGRLAWVMRMTFDSSDGMTRLGLIGPNQTTPSKKGT